MGMNVDPCASDAWAGIYMHAVDSECANLREGGNCSTLSCLGAIKRARAKVGRMRMNVDPCASDAWAGIYVHAVNSECANLREGDNCSTLSCEFNNHPLPDWAISVLVLSSVPVD